MIDLEKTKIEAEALAKLRKEQYFREVLAGELGVMIDQHFARKEPLVKTIPIFVRAVEDLALTAREILDSLEGVENDRMKLMKELEAKPITAAEPEPEKAPSTAAAPEHHFHGPIPTTPKAAEPEEPKEEETTTKTRVSSKEIVSDETLELHYFKEGLSVPVIASMYKVGASGLYKRIEAMKAQRKQIEKECARQ